jgi:hypothetical protein
VGPGDFEGADGRSIGSKVPTLNLFKRRIKFRSGQSQIVGYLALPILDLCLVLGRVGPCLPIYRVGSGFG